MSDKQLHEAQVTKNLISKKPVEEGLPTVIGGVTNSPQYNTAWQGLRKLYMLIDKLYDDEAEVSAMFLSAVEGLVASAITDPSIEKEFRAALWKIRRKLGV